MSSTGRIFKERDQNVQEQGFLLILQICGKSSQLISLWDLGRTEGQNTSDERPSRQASKNDLEAFQKIAELLPASAQAGALGICDSTSAPVPAQLAIVFGRFNSRSVGADWRM